MTLLFVDTETGGLNPRQDPLVEVAWAGLEGEPRSLVITHHPADVAPAAAALNHYAERRLYDLDGFATVEDEAGFVEALAGATLVCANPSFDRAFLERRFPPVWHHRSFDVETAAAQQFGWDDEAPLLGLAQVAALCRGVGYDVPRPDHTAAGDVRCTRAVYLALRAMRRQEMERMEAVLR